MIHKFQMLGQNIVVDPASGAVHVLDDTAYTLVDFFNEDGVFDEAAAKEKGFDGAPVLEAAQEIKSLIDDGLLYAADPYAQFADIKQNAVVKALCLHICHDCNLRCRYCFASTGSFKGERSMMTPEVGMRAIDFVIKESKTRKNIEIDYFGGEPMMNFDTVKKITEYAEEQGKKHGKNFRFTITTNGTMLTDADLEFINKHMDNIVLSIDGRKEVNDHMRGEGTYDAIVPVFKRVAESRNQTNYYVRGTFTKENLDFAEDVLHLADLGFEQISVEPVVTDDTQPYRLTESDLPQIFSEYERLAEQMLLRNKENKGFNFFHYMIDLDQGPCVYKRISGCGAGHEYVAVTPTGDIYPCHQFADKPEFCMGNVTEGTFDKSVGEPFAKNNIYTKDECKNCWARFYCSGGCAAAAFEKNGAINKPYDMACQMQKKRVECAIALKAAQAMDE